jgi:DNA-binding MltR family transcriptional regulator
LFAAAYLDRALSDLLYVFLVSNKKIEEDLFDGNAPLATFSSRIKLAYYLGAISPSVRRDLDLIRLIRNEFAHHPQPMSFATQAVSNRCRELTYSYHEKGAAPRDRFTSTVFGVLAKIHTATFTREPLAEAKESLPSEQFKKSIRDAIAAALSESRVGDSGT